MKTGKALSILFVVLCLQACGGGSPKPDLKALETQRDKLVYQALTTRGVGPDVQRAMAAFPRHEILPDELVARSYEESDFFYPGTRVWVWSAPLLGWMLTELDAAQGQRALVLGAQDGWAAGLLATMGLDVVLWDPDSDHGTGVLKRLKAVRTQEFDPARIRYAPSISDGVAAGPYERVIVMGALQALPAEWLSTVKTGGGTLIAPVGLPGEMRVSVFERLAERRVSERVLRGGTFPYLFPDAVVNYAPLLSADRRAAEVGEENPQ